MKATNQVAESNVSTLFPIKVQANLLPETQALLKAAPGMLSAAQSISITDDAGLEVAADQLQRIKGATKQINDQRTAITKPIDDAKKSVMDFVRGPLAELESAETLIKNAILAYQEQQEQARRAEEAKAAELSRRAAEKLETKADKLEASGKTEQADALRENAALQIATPSAIVSSPKIAGVSTRKDYSAEVTDLMALCKSVAAQSLLMEAMGDPAKLLEIVKGYAATNTPIQALTADTKFLNAQAKAFKAAFNFPGCKLVVSGSIASRAK